MPTFNRDLPESVHGGSVPIEAIVGCPDERTTLDDFVIALVAEGVDGDRIHVLSGEEGVDVLENVGNRLSRLFGPDRAKPIELLRSGATLVAVFEVDDDEQALMANAVSAAGAKVLHRFGRWTYS